MSFTIGSLFDGSGGFPLAAAMCGGTPVFASEVEPYPIAVTRSRFPNMKHLGDITKINGAEVEPVDIISFGSPCQDLSVAGKRAGLKHEDNGDEETTRSGLFMEAVRIIKEMRRATNGAYPRFAVWENVPGAFSSNKGEDFRIVCEELIKIVEPAAVMPAVPKNGWPYADCYCGEGWSLAYRVFDAQYWGVPQRRRRIYLVLDLGGECAGEVLFERKGLRGYFAESRTPWQRVAADAQNRVGADDRAREIADGADSGGAIPNPENLRGAGADGSEWDDRCISAGCGGGRGTVGFQWQAGAEASLCIGDELGPSLSCTRVPAVAVPYTLKIRSGCEGGGKGALIQTDKSATLATNNDQYLFQPVIALEPVCCIDGDKIGKAERAGGSGLGIRDGDKMYTLTSKDAGSHAVAYGINGDVAATLDASYYKGCGMRQGVEREVIAVQTYQKVTGPLMANSHPGSYTGQDAFSDMLVAGPYQDVIGALCSTDYKWVQQQQVEQDKLIVEQQNIRYIVRRLTPTECARLQGFADRWGDIDEKETLTDEECRFWLEVRNTHAAINGKAVKDYTKPQMLTWYNKLRSDGSEYKMWGNGIALPTALYVMQGIADVLNQ